MTFFVYCTKQHSSEKNDCHNPCEVWKWKCYIINSQAGRVPELDTLVAMYIDDIMEGGELVRTAIQ